jgi:asparagine synthase (glutamine-hydrolysing)
MPHWSTRAEAVEMLDHPYLTVAVERYHRVAAHHGIEPRHPFLDRHCLRLCLGLPDRQRLHGGWTKAVLRNAMAGRLPQAVLQRQDKQHLGWARTQALLQRHQRDVVERLRAQQALLHPYVAPQAIAQALAIPLQAAPGADDWARLFNLATLADWLERQPSARPRPTPTREKLAFGI